MSSIRDYREINDIFLVNLLKVELVLIICCGVQPGAPRHALPHSCSHTTRKREVAQFLRRTTAVCFKSTHKLTHTQTRAHTHFCARTEARTSKKSEGRIWLIKPL